MRPSTIITLALIHLKFIFKLTKIRPYKVLFQLTNDCNSRCQYCHIWKINQDNPELKNLELGATDYRPFFNEYGKNIYWIALSGGEISLFENIESFIELIKEHCPHLKIITFTTNGLIPEKIHSIALKIKEQLKRADFFVTISLDGDKDLHDQLRGVPGNYELALATKELLESSKIKTYWGLTLHNANAKHLSDLKSEHYKAISLSHDGGIYNVNFKKDNQLMARALDIILQKYNITSLAELFEFNFLKLGKKFLDKNRNSVPVPCSVLETSIHIKPNGDISPCMFLPKIGNIKDQNFTATLDSDSTQNLLKEIKDGQCPKCWMNCYAPHSMIRHPVKTMRALL